METQPELMQFILGQEGFKYKPGPRVSEELSLLAEEIIRAYPKSFEIGAETRELAREYFTDWGSAHFENQVFVFHAYTYDEECQCGAFEVKLPARLLELGDELGLKNLICACGESEADLIGGERVEMPPNFTYKPTGYSVEWYKHIRRGVSASQELEELEIRELFTHCLRSLKEPAGTRVETNFKSWPVNQERREVSKANLAKLLKLSTPEIIEALAVYQERYEF